MATPVRDRSRARAAGETVRLLPRVLTDARWSRSQLDAVPDLRRLLQLVDERAASRSHRHVPDARDLVRASGWVLRALRAPDRSCVLRSLVHYGVLKSAGAQATFVSGVRRVDGALDGHAWVEAVALPLISTGDEASPELFVAGFRHPTAD